MKIFDKKVIKLKKEFIERRICTMKTSRSKVGNVVIAAAVLVSNVFGVVSPLSRPSLEAYGLSTDSSKVYEIKTAEDLYGFANLVNSGTATTATVKLANNIDMSGKPMIPIGTTDHRFAGIFDGNNCVIEGLKLEGKDGVALFGEAGTTTIKNLVLRNVDIKGRKGVAAIVGQAVGKVNIENCYILDGNIVGEDIVASLIGYASSCEVKNSGSNANIKGATTVAEPLGVAGLVGRLSEDRARNLFINCVSLANVLGCDRVAGILGHVF